MGPLVWRSAHGWRFEFTAARTRFANSVGNGSSRMPTQQEWTNRMMNNSQKNKDFLGRSRQRRTLKGPRRNDVTLCFWWWRICL